MRAFDISQNSGVTTLAPLSALANLESLDLAGTRVRDLDLSPLEGLTHLHVLALDGLGSIEFNPDGRIPDLKILQDPPTRGVNAALDPGDTFRECGGCPAAALLAENCGSRVFRGGSWSFIPQRVRAADREEVAPDFRGASLGFALPGRLPREPFAPLPVDGVGGFSEPG